VGSAEHKVPCVKIKQEFIEWGEAQGVNKHDLVKDDFIMYIGEVYKGCKYAVWDSVYCYIYRDEKK
jgi:hypothetical protein